MWAQMLAWLPPLWAACFAASQLPPLKETVLSADTRKPVGYSSRAKSFVVIERDV